MKKNLEIYSSRNIFLIIFILHVYLIFIQIEATSATGSQSEKIK